MTNDEIVSEVGSPILNPLGYIYIGFILSVVSSPFVWIWHSWEMAWKIGLTGIIGMIFIVIIYKFVKIIVAQSVDENLKKLKDNKPKSTFQERIEQKAKERQTKSSFQELLEQMKKKREEDKNNNTIGD
jgi:uncharacterized membrane protein